MISKQLERSKEIYRCVNLFTKQNRIKDQRLNEIFKLYAKGYKSALDYMFKEFNLTKEENRFQAIKSMVKKDLGDKLFKDIDDKLTKRIQTNIYAQAYNLYKSAQMLRKFYIVSILVTQKSKRGNKNLYHDYKDYIKLFDYNKDATLKSIHRYVRQKLARTPSKKLKVMLLDSHSVQMQKSENENSINNRWLRVIPIKNKKEILIPYRANAYKDRNKLNSYQFIKTESGVFKINIVQTIDKDDEKYKDNDKIVGIDFGISDFVACDNKIFGQKFIYWLIEKDRRLAKLQATLQKNDIKPRNSKKYCALVSKIRAYTKNEVNRILNLIVSEHKAKTIRLENLEFRNQTLSKRLNRLLSKFCNKIVEEKLQRLLDVYDISVEYINPVYTSQTCFKCGYVSKNNRNGRKFKCRCCGYKANANINASNNIARRSCDINRSKNQVLQTCFDKFLSKFSCMRLANNFVVISSLKSSAVAINNKIVRNPALFAYLDAKT